MSVTALIGKTPKTPKVRMNFILVDMLSREERERILQRDKESKLIIPGQDENDKRMLHRMTFVGRIAAIGPGTLSVHSGAYLPDDLEVGDLVMMKGNTVEPFPYMGHEFWLTTAANIIGVHEEA